MGRTIGAALLTAALSILAAPSAFADCVGDCHKERRSCEKDCGSYQGKGEWVTCQNDCAKPFAKCLEECRGATQERCVDSRTGLIIPCE